MSTRGRSGRGGPTARGTGRGRSRGKGAHTPHPKSILKPTRKQSKHAHFLDNVSQRLDDLERLLSPNDPSIVAIRNLVTSVIAPTVNTTKFDTEFRQNGYQETDPKEIKKQLEESGEIKLANPLDIIEKADTLSKDKDKLAELSKEYITLMEDLNMSADFYK